MTYISFTFPEQEEAIFIHTQEATELQRSSFLKIKQQYAEDHGEKSETGSESEELIGERIQWIWNDSEKLKWKIGGNSITTFKTITK